MIADIDLLIDDLFLNLDSRASDVKGGCGFTYTFPRNWSPCNYYKTTRFGILGFIGILGFGFGNFPNTAAVDFIYLILHSFLSI